MVPVTCTVLSFDALVRAALMKAAGESCAAPEFPLPAFAEPPAFPEPPLLVHPATAASPTAAAPAMRPILLSMSQNPPMVRGTSPHRFTIHATPVRRAGE